MKKLIAALVIALCIAPAANITAQKREIKPSKKLVTRTLDKLGSFNALSATYAVTVNYNVVPSGKPSVTLQAPDNVIDYVDIYVSGKVLVVRFEEKVKVTKPQITITISGPALNSVAVSGASSVTLNGPMRQSTFDIKLTGAGSLKAYNLETDNLKAVISGAANLSLTGVKATKSQITCSGASKVKVDGDIREGKFGVSGASNCEINGLDARMVKANVSGSSKATLSGFSARTELIVSGASSIHAGNLKSENVDAKASGASSIICNATTSLKSNSAGSSKVRYSGNPASVTSNNKSGTKPQ